MDIIEKLIERIKWCVKTKREKLEIEDRRENYREM